jgi:hypothetical protein
MRLIEYYGPQLKLVTDFSVSNQMPHGYLFYRIT